MVRIGFDLVVKDQKNRKELHQEHINRRVLVSWVRITGLAKIDKLLGELAYTITKYPEEKSNAFSWPTRAGTHHDIPAIRGCVSYEYWTYFMSEGRKRLNEYNRKHNTKIEINKELTQKMSDERNFGERREAYAAAKKKVPEMSVKRDRLHIGAELSIKPSIATIKLDADLSDWERTPVKELLTEEERQYDVCVTV
ncbi:hypothetical protein Aduo_018583 [Ancylostoma duodenale]